MYPFDNIIESLRNECPVCYHFISECGDIENFRYYKENGNILCDRELLVVDDCDGCVCRVDDFCVEHEETSVDEIRNVMSGDVVEGTWEYGWFDADCDI